MRSGAPFREKLRRSRCRFSCGDLTSRYSQGATNLVNVGRPRRPPSRAREHRGAVRMASISSAWGPRAECSWQVRADPPAFSEAKKPWLWCACQAPDTATNAGLDGMAARQHRERREPSSHRSVTAGKRGVAGTSRRSSNPLAREHARQCRVVPMSNMTCLCPVVLQEGRGGWPRFYQKLCH